MRIRLQVPRQILKQTIETNSGHDYYNEAELLSDLALSLTLLEKPIA